MKVDFTFTYHPDQRKRFREGSLADEWRVRYPMLFDTKDRDLLRTGHQAQYHFFEWLSAVLLYEATGWMSLVESYIAKTHEDKRQMLREIVGPEIFTWLDAHQSGQPDLFVYRPGTAEWFFCEVKGGPDRTRHNQREWIEGFRALLKEQEVLGERVRLIHLTAIKL
jgi:hypothetical protein